MPAQFSEHPNAAQTRDVPIQQERVKLIALEHLNKLGSLVKSTRVVTGNLEPVGQQIGLRPIIFKNRNAHGAFPSMVLPVESKGLASRVHSFDRGFTFCRRNPKGTKNGVWTLWSIQKMLTPTA